jgi:four helix bundle protein
MTDKSTIVKKSFLLAIQAVKLSSDIKTKKKEYVISKQFMRSATSVGAMVRESQQAESRADFIHKLAIALKEAKEAEYWVDLMIATEIISIGEHKSISSLLKENIGMLTAIIKTTKANNKK